MVGAHLANLFPLDTPSPPPLSWFWLRSGGKSRGIWPPAVLHSYMCGLSHMQSVAHGVAALVVRHLYSLRDPCQCIEDRTDRRKREEKEWGGYLAAHTTLAAVRGTRLGSILHARWVAVHRVPGGSWCRFVIVGMRIRLRGAAIICCVNSVSRWKNKRKKEKQKKKDNGGALHDPRLARDIAAATVIIVVSAAVMAVVVAVIFLVAWVPL
jgi:hypothetical protein